MANLEEQTEWTAGIYQLETTDPVMGGPNGIDNKQAKQLANRTQYLKQQLEIPASTNTVGRVKLNSAVNSTSETDAATPKSVKVAYDTALSAQQTANTAKSIAETNASTTTAGRVKLNSAVNSTSETEAATPLAVKKVNDNAISANDKANIANANAISANSNANNAHKNIELLGGRISNIEHKFVPTTLESRVYSNDKKTYLLVRDDGVVAMYNTEKNKIVWGFDANGNLGIGTIHSSHVVGLSEHVTNMFNQSFGQHGYTRLPNGLIIQWGVANSLGVDGKKGTLQSFFIAFPNACLSISACDTAEGTNTTSAIPISTSQFKCWGRTTINGSPFRDTTMFYMAMGY